MTELKLISFTKPTPDFNRKFFNLFTQKSMVDVTFSADGQFLYAHKVVLAVASSWFEELFDTLKDKQAVIVVKDLTINQLTNVLEFIYLGAVNIPEDEVQVFKATLESFRISIDDLENDDEYQDNDAESDENEEPEMEPESQEPEPESEDFHERLFELVENEEPPKKEDIEEQDESKIKIKSEPEWDDILVKEEPISSHVPSTIQQNIPVTVSSSQLKVSHVQHIPQSQSSIRIRTPASINEKIKINEPIVRTIKFVNRLHTPDAVPVTSPNKTNIQELSKRLSKAILIRRVKKSDGSIVSERSPIKIIQGMRGTGSLPMLGTQAVQRQQKTSQPVFKCSHCNKAFTVNKRRNAHEKFCFKNPSRPASQCPFCPMVLCNPMYISTHIRKVHGIDENGKSIKT
ncbi:transcription activator GAGA-like [Chironomus tepperi]|uniref:transcription activator GAGA-like n=1 Tax=Chironomus tepperi TaxID=113505 RepID=UPI00391EEA4D